MKFNEKIIRLRKNKGMTQDDLASAVGVSRQAVYKWESAQSYPEVTKLLELKLLFGISIDDLLDDSYEIAAPEKKKRKRTQKAKAEVKTVDETPTVVETEVIEQTVAEENVVEETVAAPEVVEETVAEEVPVASPVSNNTASEEKPEAPVKEPIASEPERKVGFFGRLFGRK